MAKKKPSELVSTPEPAPEPAPEHGPEGTVKVHLLNDAGDVAHVAYVWSLDLRLNILGQIFEHVSEAKDGTWQYAPRAF